MLVAQTVLYSGPGFDSDRWTAFSNSMQLHTDFKLIYYRCSHVG